MDIKKYKTYLNKLKIEESSSSHLSEDEFNDEMKEEVV
jgi:hypothetical protein